MGAGLLPNEFATDLQTKQFLQFSKLFWVSQLQMRDYGSKITTSGLACPTMPSVLILVVLLCYLGSSVHGSWILWSPKPQGQGYAQSSPRPPVGTVFPSTQQLSRARNFRLKLLVFPGTRHKWVMPSVRASVLLAKHIFPLRLFVSLSLSTPEVYALWC